MPCDTQQARAGMQRSKSCATQAAATQHVVHSRLLAPLLAYPPIHPPIHPRTSIMARAVTSSSESSTMRKTKPRSSRPRRPARPLIWMYSPLPIHLRRHRGDATGREVRAWSAATCARRWWHAGGGVRCCHAACPPAPHLLAIKLFERGEDAGLGRHVQPHGKSFSREQALRVAGAGGGGGVSPDARSSGSSSSGRGAVLRARVALAP